MPDEREDAIRATQWIQTDLDLLADTLRQESGGQHVEGCEGQPDCLACIEFDVRRIAKLAALDAAPAPTEDRCTGANDCQARPHFHGCYADLDGTNCTDPDDHPAPTDNQHRDDLLAMRSEALYDRWLQSRAVVDGPTTPTHTPAASEGETNP